MNERMNDRDKIYQYADLRLPLW